MLLEQSIQMVYFTGGLMTNTGHGYSGIGEHTYTFTVKDVIDYKKTVLVCYNRVF